MSGLDTEESKAEKKNTTEVKSALTKSGKEEPKSSIDANKQNKGINQKGGKKLGALKFMSGIDDQDNAQAETEHKFQLDYNIDSIKQKYLYPFNESKQRSIFFPPNSLFAYFLNRNVSESY